MFTWIDSGDVLIGEDFMDALKGKRKTRGTFTFTRSNPLGNSSVKRTFESNFTVEHTYKLLNRMASEDGCKLTNSAIQPV